MPSKFRQLIQASISISIVIILWELISRNDFVPHTLFPGPTLIFQALAEWFYSGELWRDLTVSLWRAFLGFTIGSLAGILIGLLTGRIEKINNYLSPLIQLLRPLPPVAIIPLIIVWFGVGDLSKVFAIAFAVFFPVWINTHLGASKIPATFLWSAKSLKVGKLSMLIKVIFPYSIPHILAGLRTGIALAFVMVFVSELAGASAGIGYQISISHLAYRVDRMMAALVVLAFLGWAADLLLTTSAHKVFPWLALST